MVGVRIPLNIEKSERITLSVVVRCPKRSVLLSLKLIIDTGSPYSFIGRDDALRQDRLLRNLRIRERALMGGGIINITEIPDEVVLIFKDYDDQLFKLTLPNFAITDKPSAKHEFLSPSILGLDFLKENGFNLFVNMKNNDAYLERE